MGYSPWGCKESDKTGLARACVGTHTHTHTLTHTHINLLALLATLMQAIVLGCHMTKFDHFSFKPFSAPLVIHNKA